MPINILMPALSPTMERGNLAKWLKKEGDAVKSGDVIAEIETDKATMEVEAVDDGTIAKILVPEGTHDVAVNDVIAVLAGEGEDVSSAAAGKPQPSSKPAADAAPPAAAHPQAAPSASNGASHAAPSAPAHDEGRVFASPLARRLAQQAGIDLGRINGSGPHGRVIARDVEQAQAGGALKTAPAAQPALSAPPSLSDQQIRALFKDGSYDEQPHDSLRKIIAQRLVQAKQTIPHFYLTIECNLDRLLAAREQINAQAPKDKDGKPAYKLSVNDFVIKALALALQRVPDANVTWTEGALLKHRSSDVGVAVAIPGGLITPVVRDAHQKSLSAISHEMKDFAARARNRRLKPEEYQGGSTAVSNLGMYGIKEFAAVINPPQATILAVGAGEQRAVVIDGKIEIANMMSVTLSTDHRAVDGALGAELLSAFKLLIENPVMMVV
ncbi:pyruvate dehydrogenase complex dihydrolipoamide acetyltransferase [Rhodopseudomonas pseudopalustris]|uniref:pyruvate dehydrogenase complex dihydrolipoamide acetyltransferase n=1 Tax=Rhodopseudomonas pseudopalustris TaxID=1513892 RepID=UPI003F99BD55